MKHLALIVTLRFMLGMAACMSPAPPPPPPPGVPTVTLTWHDDAPAIEYVVMRAPCSNFVPVTSPTAGDCPTVQAAQFAILIGTSASAFVDSTVVAGASYAYAVVADYGNGVTYTSNIVAAQIPKTGTPVALTITY